MLLKLLRLRDEGDEASSPGSPSRTTASVIVDEMQSESVVTISCAFPAPPRNTRLTKSEISYLELPPLLDAAAYIDVSLEVCSFVRPVVIT